MMLLLRVSTTMKMSARHSASGQTRTPQATSYPTPMRSAAASGKPPEQGLTSVRTPDGAHAIAMFAAPAAYLPAVYERSPAERTGCPDEGVRKRDSVCEQLRCPRDGLLRVESDDVVAHVLGGHEDAACAEVARRVSEWQLCVLALLRGRSGQRLGPPVGRGGPSSREPSRAARRDPRPSRALSRAQSQRGTA